MLKKKLDEFKILIVLVCKDKAEADNQIALLTKTGLAFPDGYEHSMHVILGKRNLAASFNDVQKRYNAKYKFYLTAPISYINQNIIIRMIEAFYMEPKTAMVGIIGSEMPINGDYTQAKDFHGLYTYIDENGEVQNYVGIDPLFYKSVHMIDHGIFATNEDIAWDEKIGDDFAVAAHCCNFRNKGYDVGVMYQEKPMIIFTKDDFDYNFKTNVQSYNQQLEKFRLLYRKKIMPLVSVLIPTYNQPKFCCEALESALNQTYQNIEILIGDDSTNEDTKKAIRPYLKKYPNVKYFYHNGKIPRGGGHNMYFLLNNCSGEYVNYLLHDDLFYPEKISKMMQYFIGDMDHRIGLVTSGRDRIDADGRRIKRQNNWQPHTDTIIKGEEVGRRMLFILANFIGELTTVLFRRADTLDSNGGCTVNAFCGVSSKTYGDMDTWLEILKSGKDMVFMSESLSAFRKHEAQNTYNPVTRINLPLDALMFVVIAWLNDVFFHDVKDFYYCLDKWPILADRWFKPIEENDSEQVRFFKNWIIKLREIFLKKNYEKMFDISIKFLLEYRPNHPAITSHIRKNMYTGLWEKTEIQAVELKTIDKCGSIWTAHGVWHISDSNSKFGKALQFSYANSYLQYKNGFCLGGKDFTIDAWAYFDSKSAEYVPIISFITSLIGPGNRPYLHFRISSSKTIQIAFGSDDFTFSPLIPDMDFVASTVITDSWHHFELDYQHDGGIWSIYVDGKLEAQRNGYIIQETIFSYVMVGKFSPRSDRTLVGSIEEIRISDGICRHTENFDPPTELHEVDEYTKCLLHFDE